MVHSHSKFQFYTEPITKDLYLEITNKNASTVPMKKMLPKRIHYTQVSMTERYSSITTTQAHLHICRCSRNSCLPLSHKATLSSLILSWIALSYDTKPVAFANRATTNVETWYSQLDLEALAKDFGLRHRTLNPVSYCFI